MDCAWPCLLDGLAEPPCRTRPAGQGDLAAGLRVGGLREEVPCFDRDAFDFVVEGRALFESAGATAADAAAFELLESWAISEGGVPATCDAAAVASDVAAGGTGCASTGSDGRPSAGGCGAPEVGAGGSAD